MLKRISGGSVTLVLALAATASGQDVPRVAFEVASIRPLPTLGELGGLGASSLRVTPDRVEITGVFLRSVIAMAFGVGGNRVEGPGWLMTPSVIDWPRFDMHATIPEGVGRDHVPAMLRTLLAERFGLVAHIDARPVPAYELVVGGDGPKMREVEPEDGLATEFPARSGEKVILDDTSTPFLTRSLLGDSQVRTIATATHTRVVTRSTMYESRSTERGTREYDATRMTMSELADVLSGPADRPVIDKTGLTGTYQFRIELPQSFSNARAMRNAGITTNRNGEPIEPPPPSGVSVFEAVEGLGLRLESRRSPIDVLVIDRIQRVPTPN
jgi:uncharacterized protein (TIGR03435 family)